VGLDLDWEDLERLTARHGLTPSLSPSAWRSQIPVFAAGRQIGKATSGTWSPILKRLIALASVEAAYEPAGTPVQMEWTVEGVRGRIGGVVAPLPFYDPPHKRA
jgi:aminomethyltransferase